MASKYGKQVTVRSEWFNLSQYTSMSILARLLWVRINQLADKNGNVDMDPQELAYRMSLATVDMSPAIEELVAWKHVRPYTHEDHPYAAIEGYTTPEHINRQQAHKKNEAHWLNPPPPWQVNEEISKDEEAQAETEDRSIDVPTEPKRRDVARVQGERGSVQLRQEAVPELAVKPKKKVRPKLNASQEVETQEEPMQPRTRNRTPNPRPKRTMPVREVHVEGADSQNAGSKGPGVERTAKRTLKSQQRANKRAVGPIKTQTHGEWLADIKQKSLDAREAMKAKWAETACPHSNEPDYCWECTQPKPKRRSVRN